MSDGPGWNEQERHYAKRAVQKLVIGLLVEVEQGSPLGAERIERETLHALRDPAAWVRKIAAQIRLG
jgi:hypothetical protein